MGLEDKTKTWRSMKFQSASNRSEYCVVIKFGPFTQLSKDAMGDTRSGRRHEMNCPKCKGAVQFRKIKMCQNASIWEFYCENCKESFEIMGDRSDVTFIPSMPDREAKLIHALQSCLDALEEEVRYTPWPTIPRKATNAIQEAKIALEEAK